MIYEHRATITAQAGSTATTTLNIIHGLVRQIYVISNTSTTTFMVTFTDSSGLIRRKSPVVTGEYSDVTYIPFTGYCKLSILNASPDDTFKCYAGIEE